MSYNVGIDLGTTNTVCYTMENGSFKIISLSGRKDILTSTIFYTSEDGVIVGEKAIKKSKSNPSKFIKSSKTYMGSSKKWNIDDKKFSSTDVASEILRSVNKSCKSYFKTEDTINAVITVPAYFTSKQNEETKKAAEIAGFNVDSILVEPVAAALAYGFEESKNQNILVVDVGGGTFDVTILDINNGLYETLAKDGDAKLGGDDFDNRIFNILLSRVRKTFGIDLSTLEVSNLEEDEYNKTIHKLYEKSEQIKIQLSEFDDVDVTLINFMPNTTLECNISYEEFEEECSDLILKIKKTLVNCIEYANLDNNEIDKVILVGGSSNIPFIREIVKKTVAQEPYSNMDLSKLVAMGAAFKSNLEELKKEGISKEEIIISDITTHSLGIKIVDNVFSPIIPKGTKYPTIMTEIYTTAWDNQDTISISVYEGENEVATQNVFYGGFDLTGIEDNLAGIPEIAVTFEFDESYNLQVTAVDQKTNSNQSKKINIIKK